MVTQQISSQHLLPADPETGSSWIHHLQRRLGAAQVFHVIQLHPDRVVRRQTSWEDDLCSASELVQGARYVLLRQVLAHVHLEMG